MFLLATLIFSLLSSTTRIDLLLQSTFLTFIPKFNFCVFVNSSFILLIFCGIVTINMEPLPYCDDTFIFPPISSTNFLVIASPSPVPSVVVFFSTSNRSNLVNNFFIFSSFIPIPESCTVNIIVQVLFLFIHLALTSINPSFVYFIAFETKLFIICFICGLSPSNSYGISSAIFNLNSIGLSSSFTLFTLHKVSNSCLKL